MDTYNADLFLYDRSIADRFHVANHVSFVLFREKNLLKLASNLE